MQVYAVYEICIHNQKHINHYCNYRDLCIRARISKQLSHTVVILILKEGNRGESLEIICCTKTIVHPIVSFTFPLSTRGIHIKIDVEYLSANNLPEILVLEKKSNRLKSEML